MGNDTSVKNFTEIREEVQENFIRKYGRLLSEEECVKLTDEIREEIRNKKIAR